MKYNLGGGVRRLTALLLSALLVLSLLPPQVFHTDASATQDAPFEDNRTIVEKSGWQGAPIDGHTGKLTESDGIVTLTTESCFGMESKKLMEVASNGVYKLTYQAELSGNAKLAAFVYYYTEEGFMAELPFLRLELRSDEQGYFAQFTAPNDTRQVGFRFVLESTDGAEATANIRRPDMVCLSGGKTNVATKVVTAFDRLQQKTLKAIRNSAAAPEFGMNVDFSDAANLPWTLWSAATVADGIMTQSADGNGYAEATGYYSVQSGKTYQISARIKATGRSQAVLWFEEYNSVGTKLRSTPQVKFFSSGSGDWVNFDYDYVPGADIVSVKFHIETNEGRNRGGKVEWDSIVVVPPTTEPPATEPPATEPPATEPPVTEPSVENKKDFAFEINFDTDEQLPWNLWAASTVADGVLTQSADADGYAEGNKKFTVVTGDIYKVSAKIRATGRSQAVMWFEEYRADGTKIQSTPQIKFYTNGSNGWVDFVYEYTPHANAAELLFHIQANEGRNRGGKIEWDYVKVEHISENPIEPPVTEPPETEPSVTEPSVTEPSVTEPVQAIPFAMDVHFEAGEQLPWNLWDGAIVAGGVMTQSADSNGYAEGIQPYSVEQGKTYAISADIAATGRSQAVFFVWEFDEAGKHFNTMPYTKFYANGRGDIEEFAVEYIASAGAKHVLFHIQTNEGAGRGGKIVWDNVRVEEKDVPIVVPDTCVPPNGNFEQGQIQWEFSTSGGAYEFVTDANGKYVRTELTSNGQVYAYSQQVAVKPNYVYTISYRVNVTPQNTENLMPYGAITIIQEFSGGSAVGYPQQGAARNKTDGWETVTYEFITSSTAEAIRIDFMLANNIGVALWDDFSIVEKEEYKPVLLDAEYDHGGTEDTASAENLIPNGCFDNGVIQGWSPQEGVAAFQTTNPSGGVVKFEAKPGRYLQSNEITVQAHSEYELTYYVKVEDASNLEFIAYFFTGNGENWKDFLNYHISENTDGQWKEIRIRFAVGALAEGAKGFIGFKSVHTQSCEWQKTQNEADCTCQGSGTIYLDDVSVIRIGDIADVGDGRTSEDSIIYNGTFDRYFADATSVDGWELNPINPNHKTVIQNEVAKSGNAIEIKVTGHSYFFAHDFSVEPGIYILSYWVKIEQANGLKFAPYMNDHNNGGSWWQDDAAQPMYDVTDGWVKVASPVTIPEGVGNNPNNPNNYVQLGFQVYTGSGVIYLDDVSMVKTDVDPNNPNLDFELDSEILYNWAFVSGDNVPGATNRGSAGTAIQNRPGGSSVVAHIYNSSKTGYTVLTSSFLPVQPNTTYEFSYWVKIDGNYDSMTAPYIRQIAADGVSPATSLTWDGTNQVTTWSDIISPFWTYQIQGQTGWKRYSMSVTTGKGVHFVQLRFNVNGANTHVYIDDVSLRKSPTVANMDFELTSAVTGAPTNWYMSYGLSQNVISEADTSVYHSGEQSYHIFKDSLLENILVESSGFIPVSPDNTYEFSYWMCSRNCSPTATIRMVVQLYRADGTRMYRNDGNYLTMQGNVTDLNGGPERSEWTKVVTRAKPAEGAAYAVIGFLVSRGDAEIWLDDISFKVVEDGTDTVVYYDDFHAVDESGNTGDWSLETVSGDVSFTAGNKGTLTVNGEGYIYNEMKQIATDYTYTVRGKYTAEMGGIAELRFYDYMHREIEDTRVAVPLEPGAEEFAINFTAPSNSYTRLYLGSDQAGTIVFDNITFYMVAKSSKSADWDGYWVWYPEDPVKEAVEEYRFFRYEFYLDEEAEYAPFQLTVDDKYAFYLNGELIDENWDAGSDSWANVASFDLTGKVKKGKNIIALKCYNLVSEAAVLFDGKFTLADQTTAIVASSSDVRTTKQVDEKSMTWIQADYDDSSWTGCKEYGQPPCSPWGPVFYDTTLYIKNAAEVISTSVPQSVTAGRDLEFTMTLRLDSPIEANFTPTVTVYRRNSISTITSIPLTFVTYEKPLEWPVGEEFEVQCRVSIPDYFESGKYTLQMDENMLLLSGKDIYENKFLNFKAVATSSGRDNVVSSVEVVNGTPTLVIDGQPVASHFYLRPDLNVYLQTDAETRIYKSGLELYITYGGSLYKGGCDPIWLEDGSIDYDAFDEVIYELLAANNDALVMVNFGMFAPPWWIDQNPDHELLVHNGTQYIAIDDEVSLASRKFREEAGEVLRLLIQHMKEQSYYNRVFGIKIGGGQSYEWMVRGTNVTEGPDYSPVSQQAFKEYLKRIYGTEEALREAWGNDTVTFETATAPGWFERNSYTNVYAGDADTGYLARHVVDWNLFLNEESADTFLYYCQIAKEETDGKLIVGGYNGYLWTSNSYDSQGMAHTAMDRVLDSEYVDWIASPVAYNERILGQTNVYMALLDSVQEHGKLYIAEQDNRTYLSSSYAGAPWDADWDYSIGQTRTVADTIYQQKRDFANAVVNGAGLWQYDMYGGWLDDDQIYQYLTDAKAEYDFSVFVDRDVRSEVAIFVGDETYAYLRAGEPNMPYPLLEPMLMQQRKHLSKMGAGYDTYALSTLLEGKVTPHKLNIVFSPFEITDEMNEAIDKYLKCNGQYVVWVYLPGISDGTKLDPSLMKRVTGFDIGVIEEQAGLQIKLAKTNNVITRGIEGLVFGNSTPNSVSPLAYIKDTTDVTVLGYNLDCGQKPGFGLKNMGDWTSIYSSAPCLDVRILRNLLELADCHVYSDNSDDIIYANNHYVALHSGSAGEKTIHLPGNYSVYDVFEGRYLSMNTDTITYNHDANDTHIFRLMTPEHYSVTARIKGGKGTVSAPGLTEVVQGGSYSLDITAEEGYEIVSVVVNGEAVELQEGRLTFDKVEENKVIEVKFNKLPQLVEITEYIEELIILPWPAAIAILAGASVVIWGITVVVKAVRRKLEEEGY